MNVYNFSSLYQIVLEKSIVKDYHLVLILLSLRGSLLKINIVLYSIFSLIIKEDS